ncbi:MAG: type II secretion system F family protein [Nanoarchaeota archaeon]
MKEKELGDFSDYYNLSSNISSQSNISQNIGELKELISIEKEITKKMISFFDSIKKTESIAEKEMILSEIKSLKKMLNGAAEIILNISSVSHFIKPLPLSGIKEELFEEESEIEHLEKIHEAEKLTGKIKLTKLELETVKRLKTKEERITHKRIKKPSMYLKTASRFFSDTSVSLLKKGMFRSTKRDLIKANLEFIPANYISMMLFTTVISAIISLFIVIFFTFFSLGITPPFITFVGNEILARLSHIFWILFAIPLATYFIIYFYPSIEKGFIEGKINRELPFATIHMSAISKSMIDPTKMFSIISSTKEYPYLEKEFIKLINEINIYGYDLITALRRLAFYCPSSKLAEVYNGLAMTINSGGSFSEFFNKRSESLLFDYRIEKEKATKAAETFMDIYISVVVAAPMIFMLLLMMMKISGLGIALSTSMITLMIILGVSMLNVVFLTFLHLKQQSA